MISNVQLSTKEQYLLEDAKSHEEQCILKYDNYSNITSCQELKALFKELSQQEQTHLQSINQLLNGTIPSTNSGGQSSSQSNSQSSSSSSQGQTSAPGPQASGSHTFKMSDKDMCTDMLSTEKYVSHNYDISIFEFANPQIRDVLNHIQKEEQQHGEKIFQYLQSKGQYSTK